MIQIVLRWWILVNIQGTNGTRVVSVGIVLITQLISGTISWHIQVIGRTSVDSVVIVLLRWYIYRDIKRPIVQMTRLTDVTSAVTGLIRSIISNDIRWYILVKSPISVMSVGTVLMWWVVWRSIRGYIQMTDRISVMCVGTVLLRWELSSSIRWHIQISSHSDVMYVGSVLNGWATSRDIRRGIHMTNFSSLKGVTPICKSDVTPLRRTSLCCNWWYTVFCPRLKAAESVSSGNYCMWIFRFYKKLHMSKLSIKVEIIPWDKPFYEFWLLALVRNTTLSVAFYSLYNSVTEEIRTTMSIKH